MRPELPTNIESLLLQPRRDGGGFSQLKQQDTETDFASLLGAGTRPGAAHDALPLALPMLPAGDILPPGGKPLPERGAPPTDTIAVPAPDPDRAVDADAGTTSGPLALMLETGGAGPVPVGEPVTGRRNADGAMPAATPEERPVDASAAIPAVGPLSVLPLTDDLDMADVTADAEARAVPVVAPPVPQDASRAPDPAKRVTPPLPPLASAVSGDAARPLPANPFDPVPDVSGRSRPAPTDSLPVPLPDQAASPAESATRSARDVLAPVPAAPPVLRPGQSDVPVRTRPAGDAGLSIDRVPTVPTGIEQGLPGPAHARAADPTAPGAAVPARDSIGVPVQDPAWETALSERVVMMSRDRRQSAELRLSPADLGPLRVQLSVEDGKADVSFHVQHGVTREAIEQALPRLREMLADNGLQLGRCDVGGAGTEDRAASRDARPAPAASAGTGDGEGDEPATPATAVRLGRGLVDTFA